MGLKQSIPNMLTLGNLFSGVMAIMLLNQENFMWAAIFVSFGLFLDFFDGFTARMLGVSGEMGKQLDSLADMVSFGVVPGFAMFKMMEAVFAEYSTSRILVIEDLSVNLGMDTLLALPAFLITLFSALRLAKFNIDTRQSDSFIGVPTPAVTFFVLSLLIISKFQLNSIIEGLTSTSWVLYLLTLVLSWLLVAELPLLALKFKDFSWNNNKFRFILISVSLVLLILLKVVALPLIFILYIGLSLIQKTYKE